MRDSAAVGSVVVAIVALTVFAQHDGATKEQEELPPPEGSLAWRVFGIEHYRYSREDETVQVEAWGSAEFIALFEVTWSEGAVHVLASDAGGARFSAETNIDSPRREGELPRFSLEDLNSGEHAEATWRIGPDGTVLGGGWSTSGDRSEGEASSFLKEREGQTVALVAVVLDDALENLRLRTGEQARPGYEGLVPR